MIKINSLLYLAGCALLLTSCVAQKKKDDVSALGKAYHNTTARYNGYYNADLLLKESILRLEEQSPDNYSQLLPIYKYSAASNPKAVASDLDLAMEKVSVVVNLHRVGQWTDDCYLLFGKAQYLKQEYEAAQETFEFIAAEFHPTEVAKREAKARSGKKRKKAAISGKSRNASEVKTLSKKEREKLAKNERKEREKERKRYNKKVKKARKKGTKPPPRPTTNKTGADTPTKDQNAKPAQDTLSIAEASPVPGSIRLGDVKPIVPEGDAQKYIIKHRPSYQEGVLWLARTSIERENYTKAERILKQLEFSSATYPDVRAEAAIARAHLYIRQGQYDLAAPALESALTQINDYSRKARLSFILGQVYQISKQPAKAYAAFEQVLGYRPNYEMEFSARLHLATAGVNTAEASMQQLERLLREEKNREFRDQVYYAMAQIALSNGDKAATRDFLRQSLNASTRNATQKAESYLLMADLYFEDQDFVTAKLYYDSTLSVLSVSDERYGRVSRTAGNLEGIAQNIGVIALQDSLIRLSRLSEEEKRELATKIKKEAKEKRLEELKKQAAQNSNAPKSVTGLGAPARPVSKNTSSFWAYNDRQVKQGLREFQRQWGNRPLEDNWRRSSRQVFAEFGEVNEAASRTPAALTDEEIIEIFKDVPQNDKEVAAAHRQIEAAMFTLGTLYRDKLQNYEKAIETFKELLNRYPQTQYILDALYYLHLCYKDLGDSENAQVYYDKIVNGYPETRYAKILKDPNYADQVNEAANKLTLYYNQTYAAFTNQQYQEAYDRIAKVGELFGATNSLQPRFALLSAMCLGNLEGRDAYVEALKDVLAKYPEQPEAARAREILRLLGEQIATGPGQQRDLPLEEGQIENYKPNDKQQHYVIVIFQHEVSLNDAKIAVSDFNTKYFKQRNLRMNNIYLDAGETKYPLISIRRFANKTEAMDYYTTVQKNKLDFLDEQIYRFDIFPINQDNYRELLKSKTVDAYRAFFEMNYFK